MNRLIAIQDLNSPRKLKHTLRFIINVQSVHSPDRQPTL